MTVPPGGRAALVPDAYWRKTVAVVRSLGRAGCAVDAADCRWIAPAALSRYCRRSLPCPDSRRAPAAFAGWLSGALASGDHCLVLPGEESTCLAVSRARDALPSGVWAPVPAPDAIEEAADKLTSARRAAASGIPVPVTVPWSGGAELPRADEWVLKPRRGTGAYGVRRVRAGDPRLPSLARSLETRFGPLLLQARVPGVRNGYGVSLGYGPDGSCRAAFVHRKLREFPATGGVSTCAQSVRRPDLVALARRYVEGGGSAPPLPWEGVINFEFKVDDRTGRPHLIEVNPRLWGALPLAIRAGVDFPALLWRLSLGEDVRPVVDYREGVRMRWLVYGDLAHLWDRLRRGRLAWDVLLPHSEGDFLWDADDPRPFWASLAAWALAPFSPGRGPLFRR